jgi:hypothetical protein
MTYNRRNPSFYRGVCAYNRHDRSSVSPNIVSADSKMNSLTVHLSNLSTHHHSVRKHVLHQLLKSICPDTHMLIVPTNKQLSDMI